MGDDVRIGTRRSMEVTSRRLVSIRPVPFDDGESNRTRRMNTAEASAAGEASAADEELDMEDWSTRATAE